MLLKLLFRMYLREMFLLRCCSMSFLQKLASCNLKIILVSPARAKSLFTFKDKLPKILLSGLLYKYKCAGCNTTYHGKSKHHFEVQICKLLGVPPGKMKIGNNELMVIQEHLLCCNCSSFFDISILTIESNCFKLKIMEILLIVRAKLLPHLIKWI